MAGAGQTIALLGVAGVGGYVIYEYTRYSHALSVLDTADTSHTASSFVENNLGFMGYLMGGLSAPTQGTPAGNAYLLITNALAGTLAQTLPTPGTSSSGPSTTTVTTTPGTTPPPATAPPPPPPSTPTPTSADLQKVLNASVATPDQWNYAFRQLTGYGIDQLYGTSFDTIYGAVDANGNRPTGTITGDAFLNLPVAKGLTRSSSISGLGAIARFYTPVVNSMSSMVYRAHHPSPYRFPVGGGMGALTQATGFEKALWGGRFLRGNKFL